MSTREQLACQCSAIGTICVSRSRPELSVGFPDTRCLVCGRWDRKPIPLHFRVEQLPMDVQAACGFGSVAAASLKSRPDHRRLELGDCGRQIALQKFFAGRDFSPAGGYRGPSLRSFHRAPTRRRAQSCCAVRARCPARNAAKAGPQPRRSGASACHAEPRIARKCSDSGTMSSCRSRNGGNTIGTTLRR